MNTNRLYGIFSKSDNRQKSVFLEYSDAPNRRFNDEAKAYDIVQYLGTEKEVGKFTEQPHFSEERISN